MIMHRSDQTHAIRALKSAAPYIRMYKGKTFVVKAGGGVFADEEATRVLVEQIAILHYFGVRVILVHGGGPQLTELSSALGVPTRMVEGRRVTDQKSIDVTAMVLNGLINTRVLGICRDLNIEAVGISGVDAGLVRAHKRPPVMVGGEHVDYGFVGDIDAVDPDVLKKLLDNGLMPVVSPLSADAAGTLLNINADTVAAAIGAALSAEKLILCTGAPGILGNVEDAGSLISYTDLRGLKRLREEGRIVEGMLPKAKAIEDAIRGGVRRVHVVSYKAPEGILAEVFTNEGTGTLIVADINALTPAEAHSTS
jgi:acetylglutamate kinase